MSMWHCLYIGPYAEWLVPAAKHQGGEWNRSTLDNLVEKGGLCYRANMGEIPTLQKGHSLFYHYTFRPRGERAGNESTRPNRRMLFDGDGVAGFDMQDLTEVNSQEEINWFAESFREELRSLADHFGEPAALRWGVTYEIG
jgi:hypothetical protein